MGAVNEVVHVMDVLGEKVEKHRQRPRRSPIRAELGMSKLSITNCGALPNEGNPKVGISNAPALSSEPNEGLEPRFIPRR